MRKITACGLSVLAGLSAAACAAPFNGPEESSDWRDTHRISVAARMEALTVRTIAPGSADAAKLAAFARGYLNRGSGAVSVSASRSAGPRAASDVAAQLAAHGVPGSRILVGTATDPDVEPVVEISYVGYGATVAPCGDWHVSVTNTASNMAPPNFGCATQHNIAAMVANPRDFLAPSELGPRDAARRATVLEKYRKGEATPAAKTSEQSGAVSGVGQGGGG